MAKENLRLAFTKAKRGKGWQRKIKNVEANLEEKLDELHKQLISGTFKTSKYRTKTVYEPKERLIYVLPFYPDRIVHHAIMNILEPIWNNLMIYDSYSCRKGKGQHQGSKRCMAMVRKNKYCLKCDISKFYPNVNHEILKQILARKIKDQKVLDLLYEIIDSIGTPTNVPIGNYLSQWFGNLYLNELDILMKHNYHVKNYIRYCDDFVIFSNSKEELHELAKVIKTFIETKLLMKLSKCELFPTTQGVDFLGYRHFPQGYILVRKSTAKRVKRRCKSVMWELKHHKITKEQAISKIASTEGWLKHATSYNFSVSLQLNQLKKKIENYA